MLNTAKLDDWDILMLQEPWMAFNGMRAMSHWQALYPKIYFKDKTKPLRSIILINTKITTDNYEQIDFSSTDVTGLTLKTNSSNVDLINVYNDCTNSDTITAVNELLSTQYPDDHMPDNRHIIIRGDFKHHHLSWESENNNHLTSAGHMVEPLLELTTHFNLQTALPPFIPTLQALSMGNWTRPDNVWCTRHTTERIVCHTTDPGSCRPRMDHLPIHTILDM